MLHEQEIKRKRWRGLGQFRLPTTFSVRAFGELILVGLVEAFRNREPIEFVSIIDISSVRDLLFYRLSSQYIELTDVINNRCERMTTEALAQDAEPMKAKLRHEAEVSSIIGDFHLTGSINMTHGLNCHSLRCDARSKTASIRPLEMRSTRPQDYAEKMETTSELLQYISAVMSRNRGILDMGDPFAIRANNWIKFVTSFVDNRGIDLGRIQVNDADPEEWNYINTELDYEIAGASKTAQQPNVDT